LIYVVDTHAIVWHFENSARLGHDARASLDDPASTFVVPAIVLAELRFLAESRRIKADWNELTRLIASDLRFTMRDLDTETVFAMSLDLEIHDAIICATASLIAEESRDEVAVLTNDRRIRESGLVSVVW
jgi:PIN domain nuclease of toxin-antitoxin system